MQAQKVIGNLSPSDLPILSSKEPNDSSMRKRSQRAQLLRPLLRWMFKGQSRDVNVQLSRMVTGKMNEKMHQDKQPDSTGLHRTLSRNEDC